ncbi:hypothetical protein [Maribacter sp. 2304DJ31-5]|uniref:hypothetical protein n=1 Tax=Maribacter sp. 2304DJ31-5 TaxID=3386273 RepID=UPI0039BD5012
MTRRLIDYKKLDHQLAALLIDTYPYGYGDDDIIVFKNQHGELVEAVELRTADTLYLVKISKNLSNFIANFEETIEREMESKPTSSNKEVEKSIQQEMEINFDSESEDFLNID